MTDNTVLAYFYVDHLDVGQYKTGAFIPDNFDRVAINLPANEKYIANWSDWRVDDGLDEVEDEAEEKTTSKKPAKSAPAKSSKKAVEEDDEELPWEDGDLPDDEEDEESDEDSDEADFS